MNTGVRLTPDAARQLRAQRDAVRAPEGIHGAIGFEAEFNVLLDGTQVKPEDVFTSPTNIVRDPMVMAVPDGHRLAGRKRAALSEFASDDFVLPLRHMSPIFFVSRIAVERMRT